MERETPRDGTPGRPGNRPADARRPATALLSSGQMTGTQFHFRNFRLDPAARELWQDDRQVVLPASALDGLIHLIENRSRAVGRDELIAAIWGRADVADTLLAQTVLRIRREIGDNGAEDSAIRTVPRFGYRWVAETRLVEPSTETPTSLAPVQLESVTSETVASTPAPHRWRLAGALAVAALLALAGWLFLSRAPRPDASLSAHSGEFAALVWPATVPDLQGWSWLRLGLMDLVASRLRQGGMATAPSESVLAMLRESESPRIADALAVQPSAVFRDGEWTITLTAMAEGKEVLSTQASAGDVLAATRSAVDNLLIRFGQTPPDIDSGNGLAKQELLQRTRAAILADQFDLARSLIGHAPLDLQRDPEVALRMAQIETGQGDHLAAQRALVLLLDERGGDLAPNLHGRVLNALGGVQLDRDDIAAADASYAEAIEYLRQAKDSIGLGQAYSGRAAIAARQGDVATAVAELGRARVSMDAGGDPFGVAQIDMNLGLLAAQRDRPAEALPILLNAVQRLAKVGAREELAYARYALTGVQLRLLDTAGARATSDAGWPAERHTGNARLRWRLVLMRGWVLLDEGRLEEAGRLVTRITQEAAPDLDANVRIGAQVLAAAIAAGRGDNAGVATISAAVLGAKLERDDPGIYLAVWVLQLRALRASDRNAEAASALPALRAWVERNKSDRREAVAVLASAEQAWSDGAREDVLALFADAFARAERLGVPEGRVEAGVAYSRALLALGKSDQASAVAGALAPWSQTDFRVAAVEAELYRILDQTDAWRRAADRARELAGERVLPPPLDSAIARTARR